MAIPSSSIFPRRLAEAAEKIGATTVVFGARKSQTSMAVSKISRQNIGPALQNWRDRPHLTEPAASIAGPGTLKNSISTRPF